MRKSTLALLTAAAALAALLALSASAAAFTITLERAGTISAPSLGSITFSGGVTASCPLTLNGTLLRGPITISVGQSIGSITEVFPNNARCSSASFREIFAEPGTPWSLTINSVPAGLPNSLTAIEVKINGAEYKFATLGGFVNCRYRGNIPVSWAVAATRSAGVYTSGLLSILSNAETLVEGLGCPSSQEWRGTFGLTATQTLTVR